MLSVFKVNFEIGPAVVIVDNDCFSDDRSVLVPFKYSLSHCFFFPLLGMFIYSDRSELVYCSIRTFPFQNMWLVINEKKKKGKKRS